MSKVEGGASTGRRLSQLAEIPVSTLEKVKPRKAEALADWGVTSVLDLLTTYPRRYIDRTRAADVADLAVGDEAVVFAEVKRTRANRNPRGRSRVEVSVSDSSGDLTLVFFNQPWREEQLTVGSQVLVWGKLTEFRGKRQMAHPIVDLVARVESGAAESRMLQVIPVYPASAKAGLSSWEIGTYVKEALVRAGPLADPLPLEWRRRLKLNGRTDAMRAIHQPETAAEPWPARDRLVFDELLRLQLILVLRRRALERAARAIRHDVSADELSPSGGPGGATLVERFVGALPFELTDAQRRALAQIFADMAGPLPMHRLLQGDVGSGKTVVAVGAMLAAVQGGHQGALMAPTEVLADQHFLGVRTLADGLEVADPGRLGGNRPVSVGLLTNRVPAKERARIVSDLATGEMDIVIGTHALLTEDVQFRSLGAVVVDEQHRFGVEQRAGLRAKGRIEESGSGAAVDPDLLVMTATPIPRTAAMVVFGDLDMTVVDELPPGRAPVTTIWARGGLEEAAAWERVRSEVAAGHRAYVVCPLVEESDRVVARSAVEEYERLSAEVLAGLEVGLLHGQMPTAQKREVMDRFRDGEVQVLVATTVIEVGIDVPEATVVVVEDADRFGIAQLHQLRGRVGRSWRPSWCYLFGAGDTEDGATRLSAVERTTDGFELAEVDLELRGEGTILGERQTGSSGLRLAKLRRDREWVEHARTVAEAIVEADPDLEDHPVLLDEVRFTLDEDDAAFLFKS
ncbi:MAG TPA: ATP-dependent DNA helicase RecG [Acidimicrobiales bacterium]|nr:ATP-dependent DNA helicase RecG [Acidimicrobiales bacterium]